MLETLFAWFLATWLVPAAAPAPPALVSDGETIGSEDELARLPGQRVTVLGPEPASDDAVLVHYRIDDIAAEGKPWIGRVRVDGERLALETRGGLVLPLAGPLARKRIAGPGYKLWVIGDLSANTDAAGRPAALFARRMGVLAPPPL